ncbi:hypothetical protein RB628_08890 [Streptomyces sp. ADMS]|uniref:hypothetical protein n=1 Tax=Streptomyces sp. ADMS TaxID=3071415 RepID=UPI00296FC787|nr:hypothetical protein [Streptomyces sp. ADMS]MDW4905460.1 hypothetical protein [Streptomyces sp. ADMS]
MLYGQTGAALLIGAALDRLAGAGGRLREVALARAGAAAFALLPLSTHLHGPQNHATTSPPTPTRYGNRARTATAACPCRPDARCGRCARQPSAHSCRRPPTCTARRAA